MAFKVVILEADLCFSLLTILLTTLSPSAIELYYSVTIFQHLLVTCRAACMQSIGFLPNPDWQQKLIASSRLQGAWLVTNRCW